MEFENYLEKRIDRIDNAAFDLLCLLAGRDDEIDTDDPPISWDMYLIGELVDYAEELLHEQNVATCRPFFEGEEDKEEETPCYLGKDCNNKECIFREDKENA